ncbi:MAG: cellulase-like family protein [Spirochaetia bacterium]|jgi:hypothetical protein
MWDQAFPLRHVPGESCENYERVLDETIECGYNTLRLDPLPLLIDLACPEKVFRWEDPHTACMPWGWDKAGEGPLGAWLIKFMEKVLEKRLHHTLSAWWFAGKSGNSRFPAGEYALEFQMRSWTPHNYCQPRFAEWRDVHLRRRLIDIEGRASAHGCGRIGDSVLLTMYTASMAGGA